MAPHPEIAMRAVGTALAGMSIAFAVYMLAYGGGRTRVNGLEHLAIFAQPRGGAVGPRPAEGPAPPTADGGAAVDMTATGSVAASAGGAALESRPVQIVAAQADRVWLNVNGALRSAVPGDNVTGLGHIGAIVVREGGWAVLDDKGETLLAVTKGSNGAALFARKRIFE